MTTTEAAECAAWDAAWVARVAVTDLPEASIQDATRGDFRALRDHLTPAFQRTYDAALAATVPVEVLRAALETAKTSTLVLNVFNQQMQGMLCPNLLKDLRDALEANRDMTKWLRTAIAALGKE